MLLHAKFAVILLFVIVGPRLALADGPDSDGDGVPDDIDVCCDTPIDVPVDDLGRPLGDFDFDCDVDLHDYGVLADCFTGELEPCLIDECVVGLDDCDPNGTCTDLEEGYECMCNDGYEGDGFTCTDTNECADANPCGPNGDCVNDEGSYHCDCDSGFQEQAGMCVDIDECADANPCGSHGGCVNDEGSYHCDCDSGFEELGGVCVDINECSPFGICGVNAVCTNVPGSYSCRCQTGHANCDGSVGCEVTLDQPGNTCATAQYIGAPCGDTHMGFGCPQTDWFLFTTISRRGEWWFRTTVSECSTCCADLAQWLSMNGMSAIDYDIKVYDHCGGSPILTSSGGIGSSDSVVMNVNDTCFGGGDDSQDFWILIEFDEGESCANWGLKVNGRD